MLKSGCHIGRVRRWIQRNAFNGSTVTWGTDTPLEMNPNTPKILEDLAQEIADVVFKELRATLDVKPCSEFLPDWGGKGIRFCVKCGNDRIWHQEQFGS